MIGLNCGSGQRRFNHAQGWWNIDINPRWEPDIVGDWNRLADFADGTVDIVVSHHSLEHAGCGEADGFVKEAYRVLKPGGVLLVFVPDMKALAQRWLLGEIDEQIYMTNVYGAFMGDDADRHKWGYSLLGLWDYLKRLAPWNQIHAYDFRKSIPGADIAADWWILGMQCIK